ncbi:YXWGXW repeat-containing protein [Rhodopila globiformis]|uniref:YXWGXW repeat-containing protein n=1 Tax=Rhodopila globiformis TaxID=1071 RepID=UPI0011AFE18C|nr:YXWGXW repeat-containing protein [Rhodopila globiformis]
MSPTRIGGRMLFAVTLLAAVTIPLLIPQPAAAWWVRGGCCWRPHVVVGVAPPVVAVPPPVVYGPPPVVVARPVWIPGHWRGPYWIPGHWR